MNPQLSHALTLALLHFLWQGTFIAAVCAIGFKIAASSSAQVRYAIACLSLLAMPLMVVATLDYELNSSQPTSPISTPVANYSSAGDTRVPAKPTSAALTLPPTHTKPAPEKSLQKLRDSLQVWILPLWSTGVGLFCIYRLLSWIAAIRLRRRGVCAVSAVWQQRAVELTRKLRFSRAVVLLESSLTDTPLTMGALRPVILLPVGLLAGLPVEQIELVLLHELAHIRRHDYLVNLLQSLIENLLFYHPAVWWLSNQIRTEREFCCDDIVVAVTADGPGYARALTDLERQRGFAYPFVLAATGGNLVTRVRRILGQPVATRNASAPLVGLLLLGAATAAIAWQPPAILASRTTISPIAPKSSLTVEELVAQAQEPSKPQSARPLLIAQATAPTPTAQNGQGTVAPAAAAGPSLSDDLQRQARAMEETRRRLEEALKRTIETPYKKWLNEEVRWIASDEERTAFQRLQTDEERQVFIEQFWLRRDPTPDTQENEFKEEHYRRIAWANDRFGTAQLPGWKSDRGMIYIRYSPPDTKEEHPKVGPGVRPVEQGGGATTFFPYEKWHYTYIDGVGSDIILEFVDPAGTGEYRLTWQPGDKDALLHVPGAGLTLYEQMGLANKADREPQNAQQAVTAQMNMFERMRQYVQVQKAPAKAKDTPQTRWLNEEAVYIISPEERSAFQRLSTDDERQKFIEQFWLRRDPTPDTPRNEAKDEHYQRIAHANEHFATPDTPGWNTDRGAAYIVFGPPDEEVTLGGSLTAGGGDPGELWRTIAWNYSRLDGVGEKISLKFDVEVAGSRPNLWRFASGTVEKPAPNTTAYRTFGQLRARQ